MYRSFQSMWGGWKKNLYPLMGGTVHSVRREDARAVVPVLAMVIVAIAAWGLTEQWMSAVAMLLLGSVAISVAYDAELRKNGFATGLNWYGIPGRLLFAGALLASYREHKRGKLEWKGREYPAAGARASK